MRLVYSKLIKAQLKEIKDYIALDNKNAATKHLKEIKNRIELLRDFPYLGKINGTFNRPEIREMVVLGYKVIYKISDNFIELLTIYKNINLDESQLDA